MNTSISAFKPLSRLILLAFIIGAIVCACKKEESSGVDQDKIYTTYEVYYDKNADITYARAQFRSNGATGTLLQLSSPAEVRFNGDLLALQSVPVYYEKQYSGYVNGGTFVYIDTRGGAAHTLTNVVSNVKIVSIPLSFASVTRNQSNTFAWVGDTIRANESTVLNLYNTSQLNFQLFTQASVGTTDMILPASQVNNLAAGTSNATAELDRYRIDSLQARPSGGGGFLKTTYRTATKVISVN